ncbi:MAG: GTPase, partial [Elusimicrobiota bacterium]
MSILVERDHIGIFGKMNSGKSSVMNLLTQQETSIVDSKPGTTADTKTALQELHGLGPVKLFDTAGADETDMLGEKKRKKVFSDLKECDLVLIILDPASKSFHIECEIIDKARELDKQILVIYNIFQEKDESYIEKVEKEMPLLRFYKKIILKAVDDKFRQPLLNFILENYEPKNKKIELLPFLEKDEYYILIIPMDVETPPGRYLRPQAMVEEYITRNWAYPVSFRLNLTKARSKDSDQEKERFQKFLNNFTKKPKAIITDSQAMDIMKDWCPKDISLTTFSITMINYFSGGRLNEFAEGIKTLDTLKANDKILIVEACNHSRIGEDIGTVQIPNFFKKAFPDVKIDYNFGREFQE